MSLFLHFTRCWVRNLLLQLGVWSLGRLFGLGAGDGDGAACVVRRRYRIVYVWRNRGETEEEVLERQYLSSPADRFAGQTYIFSWARKLPRSSAITSTRSAVREHGYIFNRQTRTSVPGTISNFMSPKTQRAPARPRQHGIRMRNEAVPLLEHRCKPVSGQYIACSDAKCLGNSHGCYTRTPPRRRGAEARRECTAICDADRHPRIRGQAESRWA